MRRGITKEQIDARMEAFYQMLGGLEGDWTEDDTELRQGEILAKSFQKQMDRWYRIQCDRLDGTF